MSKVKKSKPTNTNTVNKNDPNQKSQLKQNKLKSSEYCESNCKDVGTCEKYKAYSHRINVLHKCGYGISCLK